MMKDVGRPDITAEIGNDFGHPLRRFVKHPRLVLPRGRILRGLHVDSPAGGKEIVGLAILSNDRIMTRDVTILGTRR